ncbi:hypothetical protein Tdes44962_MAKER06843 [Teratosphaeria destructans]|uniref:Uncharacterized protein n=1 Tax=Teratosphaeria destructans TaxID=418781 RepID=A0A9W7T171_9PEZI|nr:hypothetical protein Tdes44962_MAKER06843 [Teratosphaeria destructans]
MTERDSLTGKLYQVHVVLNPNKKNHVEKHPANALIAAAVKDGRNAVQRDVLLVLWQLFEQGMRTTNLDDKLDLAIRMLWNVLTRLGELGGMTEDFLRKLFMYGVHGLRMLESTLGLLHGGRKLHMPNVMRESGVFIIPFKSRSSKNKKAVRRGILVGHLEAMLECPLDDNSRYLMALGIFQLCDNKSMQARMEGGSTIDLPEIETHKTGTGGKRVEVDPRWEDEMWSFVCCAICGLAVSLGHKFMRWPVEIRGQVVPGTGDDKEELLEDWKAVEEEEWDRTGGKAESQTWSTNRIVLVKGAVTDSDEGSETQSE